MSYYRLMPSNFRVVITGQGTRRYLHQSIVLLKLGPRDNLSLHSQLVGLQSEEQMSQYNKKPTKGKLNVRFIVCSDFSLKVPMHQ